MSAITFPTVDWRAYGAAVKIRLQSMPEGYRELEARWHISKAALARSAQAQPVNVANYFAICAVLGLEPRDYLQNMPSVSRETPTETEGVHP